MYLAEVKVMQHSPLLSSDNTKEKIGSKGDERRATGLKIVSLDYSDIKKRNCKIKYKTDYLCFQLVIIILKYITHNSL